MINGCFFVEKNNYVMDLGSIWLIHDNCLTRVFIAIPYVVVIEEFDYRGLQKQVGN